MFTVIVENDESQWSDETGIRYHFPKRYLKHLQPGTHVAYYKGRMRKKEYEYSRLSPDPHYFGVAVIGDLRIDPESAKGDYFATILNYQQFKKPVYAKQGDSYIETIPENRKSNYWRDGVRPFDQTGYDTILSLAGLKSVATPVDTTEWNDTEQSLESLQEGNKQYRYVSTYERNPTLRKQAIDIHGVTCKACGTNFGEKYGPYAEGLIHIHHIVPVSEFGESKTVDPRTDLIPVCANCHAVIHRRKDKTLTIGELQEMIKTNSL